MNDADREIIAGRDTIEAQAMRIEELEGAEFVTRQLIGDQDTELTRLREVVEREAIASALDDARVREIWEAAQKMTEVAKARENVTVRLVALEALAHRILSALTGTQEVNDE